MVQATTTQTKSQLYDELEALNENELENYISKNPKQADSARFILGKLMVEGSYPERVAQNSGKGINWVKAAAQNGNIDALEYKTYHDIRFD